MRRLLWVAIATLAACGGDDAENTGRSCDVPDDCYPDLDHDDLLGEVECLDRVPGGYCTHACTIDDDCCAIEGECETGQPQVCAAFESDPATRCFLSCEADVIGDMDENDFCHQFANESFICRSTGAGSENRKVCVPEA